MLCVIDHLGCEERGDGGADDGHGEVPLGQHRDRQLPEAGAGHQVRLLLARGHRGGVRLRHRLRGCHRHLHDITGVLNFIRLIKVSLVC